MREKEVARFKGVPIPSQLIHSPNSLIIDLVDRTEALSAEALKRKMESRMFRSYVFFPH
jgi:hypothetical protein